MPPLQHQTNAVLDATDEATVATVITLYEKCALSTNSYTRSKRNDIEIILRSYLSMSEASANYWLDLFGVKKG